MPTLKVSIKLGDDTFDAEGEFVFDDDFNTALSTWINAHGETIPGELEKITTQLDVQTDNLDDAVKGAQIPETQTS